MKYDKSDYLAFETKHSGEVSERKRCEACGSEELEYFLPRVVKAQREYFFHPTDAFLHCGRCGTMQTRNVYSKAYFYDYINHFYDWQPQVVTPGSKLKTEYRKAFLSSFIASGLKPKSILEVSSFDGDTLKTLSDFFQCDRGVGVEPSSRMVDFCNTLYQEDKNLRFIDNTIEMSREMLNGEKFDLICSSFAFKQNAYPQDTLKIYAEHINDNGYLFIDEGSLLDDMQLFSPTELSWVIYQGQKNVIYAFTSLRYLLAKYGFRYIARTTRHDHSAKSSMFRYTGLLFQKADNVVPDEKDLDRSLSALNLIKSTALKQLQNQDPNTLKNAL